MTEKIYAPMPEQCGSPLNSKYSDQQMRAYADATHALREAQRPADPALASRPVPPPISEALSGKYGNVLTPFVELMAKELHANSAKGDRSGWLSMSREVALLEIYWHTAKLSAAVKNSDAALIQEHAADVANMSMMLLDVCGELGVAVRDAQWKGGV